MLRFLAQLEMFDREQRAAQMHFFTYLALNKVPADSKGILDALNATPQFWIVVRHGSLEAAIIALGRIFDDDSKYTVDRLLKRAKIDLGIFSRASLAARKVSSSDLTLQQAQVYSSDKHELSSQDVDAMERAVEEQRAVWNKGLRRIRNKVLAHREMTEDGERELYNQVNIDEVVSMLARLARIHDTLWQSFYNGAKPSLEPQGPKFPVEEGNQPAERVYRDAVKALERLAR